MGEEGRSYNYMREIGDGRLTMDHRLQTTDHRVPDHKLLTPKADFATKTFELEMSVVSGLWSFIKSIVRRPSLRILKPPLYCRPVNQLPPVVYILSPPILVLQVIRMFPYVQPQKG